LVIDILIRIINFSASAFILLIFIHIALSFFMDPYHPVRQTLERIVGPILNPIRRAVPLIGMFDISPIILVLLISILQSALVNLLFTLR
jgi:YggT family protein